MTPSRNRHLILSEFSKSYEKVIGNITTITTTTAPRENEIPIGPLLQYQDFQGKVFYG
jgi:hypothetical protein